MPQAEAAGLPDRAGHRRRLRHRQGHRDPAGRRGRLRGDRRPGRREGRTAAAAEIGNTRRGGRASPPNVTDEAAVQAAVDATVLAFGGLDLVVNNAGLSLSKSLLDTTVADWDLQHNVMAKGSFLVSRAAAKVLIEQQLGGDIVYISSKNSLFAGPEQHRLLRHQGRPGPPGPAARRRAGRARGEGQRHQPRRGGPRLRHLRRRLGRQAGRGVRRAPRRSSASTTPSAPCSSGRCCRRTCANAVFVLCSADLSHTTGLHIPVDAGVAAAFLR